MKENNLVDLCPTRWANLCLLPRVCWASGLTDPSLWMGVPGRQESPPILLSIYRDLCEFPCCTTYSGWKKKLETEIYQIEQRNKEFNYFDVDFTWTVNGPITLLMPQTNRP